MIDADQGGRQGRQEVVTAAIFGPRCWVGAVSGARTPATDGSRC